MLGYNGFAVFWKRSWESEETPQAITVSDDEEDMLEVLSNFPQGG